MRLTFEDRLKMCEDYVLRGKSLSHISEKNGNYDITNLKYLINLYKKFGSEVFLKVSTLTGFLLSKLSSEINNYLLTIKIQENLRLLLKTIPRLKDYSLKFFCK
ncbi:MAG: hypothetical protein KKH01_05925 [Firmicutes bacterium]|nr:hypothetical protein [Bacillota bacterium]